MRMEQSGFRPDLEATIRARTTAGRSSSVAWDELSPGCINFGIEKENHNIMNQWRRFIGGLERVVAGLQ